MKKIDLLFFLFVTIPFLLQAQQKAINPQTQPVQKNLQPATQAVAQPSQHREPSLEKLVATQNKKVKTAVKHRYRPGAVVYGNEWINYSQFYYKIKVGQNGIYRVDSATLAKAGIPVNTIDSRKYQVFFQGQQQYIYVKTHTTYLSEKNGDYIEFYGQYNNGTPDSLVYYHIKFLPNPYYSLFTDTSTYYLTWNSSVANNRMIEQSDTAWNSYLPAAPYIVTAAIVAGRAYSPASSNNRASYISFQNAPQYSPGAWLSDGDYTPNDPRFTQNSAWTNSWAYDNSGETLYPDIYNVYTGTGAPNAFIKTVVLGEENGNCTFSVYTSNHFNLWTNVACDSFAALNLTTTFPANNLSPGLGITYYNNAFNNTNIITPTYVYLTYPHTPDLAGDTTLTMTLNDSASGPAKAYLDFTNMYTYHSNADSVRMYDLTNHNRFWLKASGGGFKVLVPNSHGQQQCFLTSDSAVHKITTLIPVGRTGSGLFTNFSSEGDSAFLIITHPSLWSSAQAYASYRSSAHKHYNTVVADVQELYDQFGEGIDYSPLGIRRFCNYAIDKWASPPSNLFLIGKGIHTPLFRSDTAKWTVAQLLMPSFGYPSSDILFTSGLGGDTLLEPAIPTGRLAAATPAEVNTYLNKVETYESTPPALWMKNIAHFAGGDNASEENIYASFLNNYAATISDTLFGGRVYLFQKSTAAPISGTLTDSVLNLINNGVSIMTFFGHAGGADWSESVDYPSDYSNTGKYPLMMADACFSGDIFQPLGQAISSVSEQWVLNPPGAIGFLASDYLGNPSQLNTYTQQIYNGISHRPFYRKPIGQIIQNTVALLQDGASEFMICTCLESILHGDPAIAINAMDSLPDYAVNNQSIYFSPANVSVLQDSFKVNVIAYNYGEALKQAVPGVLTRTFPNGIVQSYPFTIAPPKYTGYLYYADTITVKVPVNDSNRALGAGLNEFSVSVDLNPTTYAELSYSNNSLSSPVPLLISSEDITPVWPYDYAIIPADTITLKASTNDAFAPQRTYVFEIDTSHNFNSPLFRSDTVTNSGGVIMLSPYDNWGTTYFNGLGPGGNGNSGNRMAASAPLNKPNVVASASAVANVAAQNAQIATLATAPNKTVIANQSLQKSVSAPIAKQATAAPTSLMSPVSVSKQKGNVSAGKLHRAVHGPIRESFLQNAVYYWRVRRDTADTLLYPWVNSSFQYIKGKNGWGQSGFFQFDDDEMYNDNYNFINFNGPARNWSFNTNGHTLKCFTFGMTDVNVTNLYATEYEIDDFVEGYAGCQLNPGIYVAVIDKTTLQPWSNHDYNFNNANNIPGSRINGCDTTVDYKFEFWDNVSTQTAGLINMLNSVPVGDYILAYSWYEGQFRQPGLTNDSLVVAAFENLGATQMGYHRTTPGEDSVPWIFFVQKGNPAGAQQIYGPAATSSIQLSTVLKSNDTYGAITSPLIGPAVKYDSLSWFQHPAEKPPLTDSTRLNIIGIGPNGNAKTLEADITPSVANMYISSINPTLFPYIQLMLYTKDGVNRTPAQMNWWRVFYQPAPEIAMNPNIYTYYHADTLQYGDTLRFQTTVQNISDWPIDSTQLLAWTMNSSNVSTFHNPTKLVKPLNPGDTAKISFAYPDPSSNSNLLQSVWLEINPESYKDTRLEQYHFNNYAEKSFYSYGDKINPILDVTFDGVHILNNDIVSAQPSILMSFSDENKFLALNNPADFKVYLNPVGSPLQLISYGPTLSFTPATLPQNRCSLLLTPTLPDGTYQLMVQGSDASGNLSANNSYTIDFEVINKSMISQVVNYPNPFSTSTRFVFTLTGSEIPTIFKIQIMTITGKIVREINEDEIGPIHIGTNITRYAWDGTDQYGSKLANGVYLYRVVTSINGQGIDDYQTAADKYFTKGWGKMFIMR